MEKMKEGIFSKMLVASFLASGWQNPEEPNINLKLS